MANTAVGPNDTEMVNVSKGLESIKHPNMDDLEQCDWSKDKRSKDQLSIDVYKQSCKETYVVCSGSCKCHRYTTSVSSDKAAGSTS
jgi:hypothetical protein